MTSDEYIKRIEKVEQELEEARQNRHAINTHNNKVVEQMQLDLLSLDDCVKKITVLLEGAFGQSGLVKRIDKMEDKITEMREKLIQYGAIISFLSFLGSGIGMFILKYASNP